MVAALDGWAGTARAVLMAMDVKNGEEGKGGVRERRRDEMR